MRPVFNFLRLLSFANQPLENGKKCRVEKLVNNLPLNTEPNTNLPGAETL